MSRSLIEGNPKFHKEVPSDTPHVNIAEFFCDTVQGEGVHIGIPATFLRVQHCSQSCIWCDSSEVWRQGNPYTFQELFDVIESADLIRKFKAGQHLVLTGGSPVKAQKNLVGFLQEFKQVYGFLPYIEIENESTLMPSEELIELVDCWNNSPKLENSYNPRDFRLQPVILKKLSSLKNSWFKFVVFEEEDWQEIKRDFLDTELIQKNQIILMPLGATREELLQNRQRVVDIAVRENVRYSTREHVILWDKKTGV